MCSFQLSPTITTERLTLRAPALADAPKLAAQCADFSIPRMTTRMPWPFRLEDAQGFVEKVTQADPGKHQAFVVDHPTFGPVGVVGLHAHDRFPELGYWIGRSHWGRGYATEAVRAALSWARHQWKQKVIQAGHFADNHASAGVLVKSGFLYTGDVVMKHSIARGEDVPTRMMVWIA